MSRFAVIDIPDYTPEEKKIIFSRFALPKVLKRIGLQANECTITEEGLDAVVEIYSNTSGIRDLEQAAEHLAANALYQIEVDGLREAGSRRTRLPAFCAKSGAFDPDIII